MSSFAAILESPVVSLVGADARRFCNSMFTNNARDLQPGRAQQTAMLDDRGRVQGLMDLYCEGPDRFVAVLDGVSAEDFGSRYELYVVLDDVTIEVREGWAAATVQGHEVEVPEGLMRLDRDRSGCGGFDVVGPAGVVGPWVAGLGLPLADRTTLEAGRVRAGVGRWPVDFGDRRLAHEMGMRERYLHFEKGCYVGQETVNRVDVMGQVKRQLAGLSLPAGAPAGARLSAEGNEVGVVTTAVDDPVLGRIGLAVIRKPFDEVGSELESTWDGGSGLARVVVLPMTTG